MSALALLLFASNLAMAQEAPAPRKMPRVPVKRQTLEAEKAATILKTRDVSGTATIIDGEHLRMNDIDIRLFGIVPPQLSASFGPQARSALDEMTRGQVTTCHVRDRDHDGRYLATCTAGAAKSDLALELVKRGLAVTARGSLQPTELAGPYESAEDAAQKQKLGLWTTMVPPEANVPAPVAAPKAEASNVPPLPTELKKETAPPEKTTALVPAIASLVAPHKETEALPPVLVTAPVAATAVPVAVAADDNSGVAGFFARYQLLITGLVMLATALSIMIVLAAERRRDKREEMRAIAAALRGELLAARAVCQGRLKTWSDVDDKTAPWPRIRATLYQAYVGKVGWLGAVLARQVASIYGQSSDYAAYFNPNSNVVEPRGEAPSKRKALQMLVQHIEEVLPKLSTIEQTGLRPKHVDQPQSQSTALVPHSGVAQYDVTSGDPLSPYDMGGTMEAIAPPAPSRWNLVKRLKNNRKPEIQAEDALPDYTALLEEEMARMSSEDEASPPPTNVTKIRGNGSN